MRQDEVVKLLREEEVVQWAQVDVSVICGQPVLRYTNSSLDCSATDVSSQRNVSPSPF
jgi:hypothetical protein